MSIRLIRKSLANFNEHTHRVITMCIFSIFSAVLFSVSAHAQSFDSSSTDSTLLADGSNVDEYGYRITPDEVSEFDNQSSGYVKDWRTSDFDYDDTEFGELMYNESSTPTKLEILRLLSKETPSTMVFMNAVAMGLGIDDVLQAAIKFQPEKNRQLASSAVSLLPLLTEDSSYLYSSYELEDLEREDETLPYSVERVIEKFFKQRLVLRPYPDWFDGQYHFLASAKELRRLQEPQKNIRWYRTKSTEAVENRPIFVSLYEGTGSVLIDGEERIVEALKTNSDALLPVVFVFNRLNERSVDELGYPATIRGVQRAYSEKGLMTTPAPEWELGEYHLHASMEEMYEVFDIPEPDDFEPETWQKLLSEAEEYSINNTSFLVIVIGGGDGDGDGDDEYLTLDAADNQLYAQWDNPRSEEAYPYTAPDGSDKPSIKNLVSKGLVFNRTDLVAALNALGVVKVPVAFYYLDNTRLRPYIKGPQALIKAAVGVGGTPNPPGGGGFGEPPVCASPPCQLAPQ